MGEDITTSGGSLHPGRPVIWESGKKNQTSVAQQAAQQSAKVAPTPQEIMQAQAAAKIIERGQVARQFSRADLQNLLMSQNIPVNEANENLATAMLRYGIEVSSSNFSTLATMVGADSGQTTLEASIILFSKGIQSPAAVKILSKFLSENPQLAAQLMSVKGNVSDLMSALSMGGGVMNNKLLTQLTAILSQFLDELEGAPGKYKFSGDGSLSRTELLNDCRAMKALLDGIPKENLPDTAEGQVLDSNITATSNRLDQMIQGLTSQAMLSKQTGKAEVNYSYYQIPNPLVKSPSTVDLIVKRSQEGGGKSFDADNTEIIMSFDTENLGRITVKMMVTA